MNGPGCGECGQIDVLYYGPDGMLRCSRCDLKRIAVDRLNARLAKMAETLDDQRCQPYRSEHEPHLGA